MCVYYFFTDGQFLKPEIVLNPKSQDVLKGENITLNCSAASTESQGKPTKFKWKKDESVSDFCLEWRNRWLAYFCTNWRFKFRKKMFSTTHSHFLIERIFIFLLFSHLPACLCRKSLAKLQSDDIKNVDFVTLALWPPDDRYERK